MTTLHKSDQEGSHPLNDSSARTLVAGDLRAVFLPDHGMLGASLRYKGMEILRRVEDLEAAAARGSSAGILLLHPWATVFLSHGIVCWGKRSCSIGHRHFSISTSMGCQCTVCHGRCCPG